MCLCVAAYTYHEETLLLKSSAPLCCFTFLLITLWVRIRVNHIVETIGVKAGVTNPNPRLMHLNPHLFRHSIARFLKSKCFSAEWIQNFLGHESYKTTMDMYGTLSIDEMQEVGARLLD